jgi:SAM-dependent methyltransferase
MINPKDIINTLTVEELCETADDYFKSIVDPTPQMAKPFSSLIEGPEILQNMGFLLSGLRLGKTMKVLEFGAGTCWFSRYLNQLQCQTISCDASKTALEIGQRLFEQFPIVGNLLAKPLFLNFDGHKIDLPSESVDRIVCYDAFHHIPNQEEVISELARVLKPGGIVGFSEPGRFHSQSPQSQYEMNNYTVLENDIIVSEIFAIAKKYGFDDIRFKVLADLDVSLDQYHALINRTRSNVYELVNNNVSNVMTNRTVFFLYKGKFIPDSRSHLGLAHSISTHRKECQVGAGEDLEIAIKVTNRGEAVWLHENIGDIGVVKVGTHLYDEQGHLLDLDFSRHLFEQAVKPGETIQKTITLKFAQPGVYKLSVDLVSEAICWFENVGSKPQFIKVTVK